MYKRQALGGMGTSGLLNAWCPFTDKEKIIYKGIAEKVFMEAKKGVPHARGYDWVPINTEYLKVVYDDLVMSQGVSVLFLDVYKRQAICWYLLSQLFICLTVCFGFIPKGENIQRIIFLGCR